MLAKKEVEEDLSPEISNQNRPFLSADRRVGEELSPEISRCHLTTKNPI
jgi:hypothetical protein